MVTKTKQNVFNNTISETKENMIQKIKNVLEHDERLFLNTIAQKTTYIFDSKEEIHNWLSKKVIDMQSLNVIYQISRENDSFRNAIG